MDEARGTIRQLSDLERSALLSFAGAVTAEVTAEIASRLEALGLAILRPDGYADLSPLGQDAIVLLQGMKSDGGPN